MPPRSQLNIMGLPVQSRQAPGRLTLNEHFDALPDQFGIPLK